MRRRQFALLETWGQVVAFFYCQGENMAGVVGQRYELYNFNYGRNRQNRRNITIAVNRFLPLDMIFYICYGRKSAGIAQW
jgi:hypothetical protein